MESISDRLSNECAVLVMSCDAYEDLWPPFFTLLDRYWPDCPFDIYLGAETKEWRGARIKTLKSQAGGRNWSGRLIEYLQKLPHASVVIILDDFFLRSRVSNTLILDCLFFAQNHKAVQVRLVPKPPPTVRIRGQELIGESEPGTPYRLSTQAAIWDRKALMNLLRTDESIWDFEHNGNNRAANLTQGFYSAWRPALPYLGFLAHHVVEKGKWLPHEKWIFKQKSLGCDFSKRGTLSVQRTILYHSAQLISLFLSGLPLQWQISIKTKIKAFAVTIAGAKRVEMGGRKPGAST